MLQETTDYLKFEGKKVYFEMAGEGTPLVFMHAGIVDSQMWDDQWREFSKHFTVIRYDMLGFGKSDSLDKPVSRRQELYRVFEATGIKRAILVGCSLSGETILDVALERPELVSGLVVVSAVPGGFEFQGEPPQDLMDMMAALEQGDLDLASEHQMRLSIDGPYRQPEQVDPLVRQRAAAMNQSLLAKDTLGLTQAPSPDPLETPAVQRLDQIKAPTLIIAGELDNPEILRAAEVMAGSIPGAQKANIPGGAHLPNMERPAEFNQVVMDFLKRYVRKDQ